ncbi:MAG TPA: HAD family hydrolase [Gemmatimonadaceae bacterium]|nr:HAD family hydrolase [Gemmatimonadaceae bacterium]
MSDRPAAVFLDRDGTVIEDAHYIKSADQVRLLPGAAPAVKRLNDAGISVIVATNQSGIARGIFTVQDYETVRKRFEQLLAENGAHIDASYYCPHPPVDPPQCNCRKPGTMMFEQAISDFGLRAKEVAYIGDRWRDVVASKKLGGRGIMIASPETSAEDREQAKRDGIETARSLSEAVSMLLDGLTRRDGKS